MLSRQRYVILGVLALAVPIALVLSRAAAWACGQMGWPDPSLAGVPELSVSAGLGWGLALALATAVLWVPRSRQLAGEIVEELARVSWPARDETVHATMVVIMAVVVSSAYLGLFDAMWLWVTNLILSPRTPAAG